MRKNERELADGGKSKGSAHTSPRDRGRKGFCKMIIEDKNYYRG